MRSLEEIKKDFLDISNMSCKPSFTRPKDGAVIDEEKSVRWNREEVIRLQIEYGKEVEKLNTLKNKRRDALYKELYKVIKSNVKNISLKDAEQIFTYIYSNYHSYGIDTMFIYLEELMELISDIVNKRNEKNI